MIGPFCIGKQLTDLVHPHDVSLLKMHIQVLQREGHHLSSVYRLVFPPPHYTVHVKTKSKIFKPDAASPLKEFVKFCAFFCRFITFNIYSAINLNIWFMISIFYFSYFLKLYFPESLRNRLISAGLEPVLSNTEKSCIKDNFQCIRK